eukprot:4584530-Alexandrium_andersonii.AAC.1
MGRQGRVQPARQGRQTVASWGRPDQRQARGRRKTPARWWAPTATVPTGGWPMAGQACGPAEGARAAW